MQFIRELFRSDATPLLTYINDKQIHGFITLLSDQQIVWDVFFGKAKVCGKTAIYFGIATPDNSMNNISFAWRYVFENYCTINYLFWGSLRQIFQTLTECGKFITRFFRLPTKIFIHIFTTVNSVFTLKRHIFRNTHPHNTCLCQKWDNFFFKFMFLF